MSTNLLGTYQGEYLKGRYHGRGVWKGNLGYLGLKPKGTISKETTNDNDNNNNENNNNKSDEIQNICVYIGDFENGYFHGSGKLMLEGGKYEGIWHKGQLSKGGWIYDDGLVGRELRKDWIYCTAEDPRFYSEITAGFELGAPLIHKTSHKLAPVLPPNCYEVIDGYFDPKRLAVFSHTTNEQIRMPDKDEKEWIVKYCRHNPTEAPTNNC